MVFSFLSTQWSLWFSPSEEGIIRTVRNCSREISGRVQAYRQNLRAVEGQQRQKVEADERVWFRSCIWQRHISNVSQSAQHQISCASSALTSWSVPINALVWPIWERGEAIDSCKHRQLRDNFWREWEPRCTFKSLATITAWRFSARFGMMS